MVSKIKAEDDEKSSEPQSSLILPSLPEDVIIDILARSSRSDHPTLSLVSKHFRSLVASPHLHARRSLLACKENCLYVALYDINNRHHWYTLCRKANGSHSLVRAPSTFPYLHYAASSVAVGSKIYVFSGVDDKNMRTNAFSMDCRSHTVEPLPSIPVPMYSRSSCVIDKKIYVIGYCPLYPEKAMLMFNIETQTWEHVMTTPEMNLTLTRIFTCVVMAGKIYTGDCYRIYVYEPKESKWETENMLSYFRWVNGCVVDDVFYYYDRFMNNLIACDPNKKFWGVVEGVDELSAELVRSKWSYTVRYGGNMALLFGGENKIWCVEISLERRQGGKVWGEVKWCDHVFTGNFEVRKSLTVMV